VSVRERIYRGRFAPTPSGDLHLGGARTALVAWLDARAQGGELVLRVEDLDQPRLEAGAEARILDDLRWMGLDWNEGPGVGGDYAPYRQSEKLARYAEVVAELIADGRAYPCFCSRREIALASLAPHGPSDDGPRYPGTCRKLTRAQIAEKARRRPPSIRLRVDAGQVAWMDRLHGECSEDVSAQVGDFVLRRADLVPAYQLAVVVDDGEMRISDVVRADDLLPSTARQLLLYRALGWKPPRFLHAPLVLGPDGVRLSKRHGAVGVRASREAGMSAARVVGALAATLGLADAGEELMPSQLVARYDVGKLVRAPVRIDPITLVPAR
jgi:glutamyl-tRNA synthetase